MVVPDALLFLFLSVPTSSVSTSSAAEEPIPEVLVTAPPLAADAEADPTASVSVIGEARLEQARRRGEDVAELLDTVAGARTFDLGGPVGDRRLTIRGGAPSQLLTVVDGVVLGSSFATGVDLGFLVPEAVGSMRVVRGGQGALYGDGALTGALVVTTRRPSEDPTESLSLSGGSFGTLRVGGSVGFAPVAVSATYEQTAGDFAYEDRAVGLAAEERTRRNNDARRGGISAVAEHRFAGNTVRAVAHGSFREAGVPGLTSDENLDARESRQSVLGRVAVDHPLQGGTLSLGIGAAYLSLDYRDPESAFGSESEFITTTADAKLELMIGELQIVRALAEIGGELADSTEHGDPTRFRASIALSDEIILGSLTVFLAGRAVSVSGQRFAALPRVGLRWDPLEWLYLRVGAGRSLRTPAVDELYRPSEAGLSGNPELVSETAWEAEAAIGGGVEAVEASLVGFVRRIDDAILYVNRNAFEVRPENLGAARAAGGELEVTSRWTVGPVRLGGYGALGLLFSELLATGERLPTQPVWNAAGRADVGYAAVDLFTAVRWFGPTSTRLGSDLPENRVPAYLRWDAGVEVRPFDWMSVAFRCLNLIDRRDLQSVNKIPLPGRTFLVSARVAGGGAS